MTVVGISYGATIRVRAGGVCFIIVIVGPNERGSRNFGVKITIMSGFFFAVLQFKISFADQK